MKRITFFLLWLPFAAFSGPLQEERQILLPEAVSDTVYVSDTETTYLLFPEEVLLVDIGRTGEYFAKIEGKSVFLKARNKQSGPTNMLIRFGQAYFTARLIFAERPEQYLYAFDKRPLSSSSVSEGKGTPAESDSNSLHYHLSRLKMVKPLQAGPKDAENSLSVQLTHLWLSQEALLLGVKVSNSSSIDYKLDFVGFTYEERRGRRLSRNNRSRKEVRPYLTDGPALIPGQGESSLFYALPLYAMSSRGRLRVLFREKEGARLLEIHIPARRINQAPFIVDGYGS